MKLILASITLFSSISFAQLAPTNLSYYNVNNCSIWTYSTEGRGYVCASYPSQVMVPDVYSTADNLNALNDRIKKLEDKVQQLEAQLKK